tara:strand:- start:217 stop:441 length:225 start_codon:yes stop_codon:yes gene_type:complete
MKVGDLVHMPGETLRCGSVPSVGIVIDESDSRVHKSWAGKSKRIGIMWVENWGKVDYEPREWLEVVSEAVPVEA